MRGVAGTLALAVEQTEPPPQLRGQILAAARAESAAAPSPGAAPPRAPAAWWHALTRPIPVATATATLLLAVVALAVWVFVIQSNLRTSQEDLSYTEMRLAQTYEGIGILSRADRWWGFEGADPASDASGVLAYSSRHSAACLIAWDLAEIEGKRYHAWSLKDGVATAAGTMWSFGDSLWLIIDGDVDELDAVTITAEESRKPAAPSGPVVATVRVLSK